MSNFKTTPASIRYLGARLKPFRRPMFWGSIGLASLIGFAIYQYWQNPDWLNADLTELETTTDNSISRSSSPTEREQLSADDLAIGAELDNLDLLLQELEQNQTVPLNIPINSKQARKELKSNNKDTIYHRFQEKQKAKPDVSMAPLIPTKTSKNNLVKSPTRSLFEFPGFSGYNSQNSLQSNQQNSTSSQPELIPNPVGRLYLSNRDRTFQSNQSTIRPNSSSGLANQFSPVNPNPTTAENSETNLSSQTNPSFSNPLIRVNTGQSDNSVTPSLIPDGNSLNAIPSAPGAGFYGQSLYQQPANQFNPVRVNNNVGVNPSLGVNTSVGVPPTRLQPNNLSNQQQTLRYYQLTPGSYQLQPQGYNSTRQNSNLVLPTTNFSPDENFNSSQFSNDTQFNR